MPPKTEELFYQQPSSNDSPISVHDSSAAMSPAVGAVATATNSRNILPPKDSVPFLKRRQISTASLSGSLNRVLESSDCIIGIILTLETLESRVAELLARVQMEELQGRRPSSRRVTTRWRHECPTSSGSARYWWTGSTRPAAITRRP
jgi:hypothetical protein